MLLGGRRIIEGTLPYPVLNFGNPVGSQSLPMERHSRLRYALQQLDKEASFRVAGDNGISQAAPFYDLGVSIHSKITVGVEFIVAFEAEVPENRPYVGSVTRGRL